MDYSQKQLASELAQLFEDEDAVLLDLTVSPHNGRVQLRVIGDRKTGGFTIDDCVRMTRQIQHLIDERKLLSTDYRLEVSSPGLDFPLRERWQFKKNIDRLLKLSVSTASGQRDVSGRLVSVDSNGVTVASDANEWQITYPEILSARVLPEFHSPRTEGRK